MDHEYLQNVMGSPYVQEGEFSRLKAKGAQAMGALGAMAGHQIQSPVETKLHSLWDGFIASLKGIMKDWSGQVSPMFDQKVPITNGQQQQVKESLDELAKLLTSAVPQNIGSAPDKGYHDSTKRNQRDNPQSYVRGSAYNRSTTSPTKLTEMVEEGFWDAANRDVKLNTALGSNDPSTILDSYKNHILSMFQNFMKDAVKTTKMTAQQVYSVLAKMQPSQPGWQATANMQKVVAQLKKLQGVGDITGKGAPPIMHPPAAAGEAPPVIQKPPQAQPPAAQAQPPANSKNQPTGGSQQIGDQGGDGTISSQEYPSIILHAIRIINNAVTSDSAHAGHFFDADQSGKYNALPTTFSGTSLSKESKLGNILKEITAAPKKGGEGETEPDVPGEFLYNFHSKFHKWPGQPFSMDVKPVGMSNEVPGLQGVKIEVIWNCNKTLNRIYVIADKNGKKTKPLMIMQFYDHHVSSQAGATGGGTNQFSVEKLVQASNPTAGSKLASAPPEIREAIQKESETLMRSLMATTYRKPMEFKSKRGKKVFPLKWDEAGNVTYKDAEGIAQTIDHNGVTEKLEGDFEDSQKWADSLEHFGYFEAFPGKKPKDIDEYPEFGKAFSKLLKSGKEENAAKKLLYDAWVTLRKEYKKPAKDITAEELVELCNDDSGGSEDNETPQAFNDATMALEKLGWKKTEATKRLTTAWVKLSSTKSKKDITTDDLVNMVLSGKPNPPDPSASTASNTSTPVSKPASAPAPTAPVSAPVSGAAGAPAPTTNPTAPVSFPGGKVSNPKTIKLPTLDPKTGKMVPVPPGNGSPQQKQPSDSGKIDVKGDDLEWENTESHEVHSIGPDQVVSFAKNKPKFLAALKANPTVYEKYKDMINQKIAQKKKGPKPGSGKGEKPAVSERLNYINPFNRDNLLLS